MLKTNAALLFFFDDFMLVTVLTGTIELFTSVGDREILTEGKLLLLACENGSLQGFGLHSRKKVMFTVCDFVDVLVRYTLTRAVMIRG